MELMERYQEAALELLGIPPEAAPLLHVTF